MRKLFLLFFTVFLAIACSSNKSWVNNLSAMSSEEVVSFVNDNKDKFNNVGIDMNNIMLDIKGGKPVQLPIKGDNRYVAVAPYFNTMHDCFTHSITGCRGELPDTDFNVSVSDLSGNIVYNGTQHSLSTGFFEIWLPKDSSYIITVEKDSKKGSAGVSTRTDGNTCLTTLKLID